MCMRTTLSIDDDVLAAARDRARREGRSVGSVLSELARSALSGSVVPTDEHTDAFLGFEPLPPRGAIVTNQLINNLRDDEP